MSAPPPGRTPTPLDALADRYVDRVAELDPFTATHLGVPGHDTEVTDYSPEGHARRAALDREVLAALEGCRPVDDVDRTTLAAMRERLGLSVEIADAGLDLGELNVLASPLQTVRDSFDLMPTATAQDWAVVATRLSRVGEALGGYAASLRAAADAGNPPARRQVRACAEQCAQFADAERGVFAVLLAGARPDGAPPQGALERDLRAGAAAAAAAYGELGRFLREELHPRARAQDAVGRDAYALWSRAFLGAEVDLEETYAWGLEEVARIEAEMARVAERVVPGATTPEAIAALEADPARQLHGTAALQGWMQELSDSALAALADVHFDVPAPVRRLECRIAPTTSGGIYYTGPSEDFSRPGRMWWSVPEGVSSFGTWRERTTVFHEGVPGHHLQVGQTLFRRELLNRWRRMLSWVSGHGEGWALYAERLMADLGWLEDPADRMGMLDASLFRAARVVVDIGTHCGFLVPAELDGGAGRRWDADAMWTYLRTHTFQQEDLLRFEHLRYLGWPGQAPSYKVGERLWLELRERVRAAEEGAGRPFDLRAFHRRALDVGSVGLDVLRDALTG
ncbi:DUF885 domain-containing protein [Quadrisphaera sp. DSM 44207]|uniref:DUF885 domain-containing protein n=1 Tax=Quadrisphaera sp. DSM 44207 TaxID=1881057 RepID=UPI00088C07A7|nr:DUF885 domain-containing protein [Quadrisphaera sp. DSM 44207]SDQ11432.1 Uncharacterized conserved protein, DUF885 familyt [Quadrisphaera sp. DSM 44207]